MMANKSFRRCGHGGARREVDCRVEPVQLGGESTASVEESVCSARYYVLARPDGEAGRTGMESACTGGYSSAARQE